MRNVLSVLVLAMLCASTAVARMQPPEPAPPAMLTLDTSKLPIIEATIDGMPEGAPSDTAICVANMQPGVPASAIRGTRDGAPLVIALVAPEPMLQALTRDLVARHELEKHSPPGSQLVTVAYSQTGEKPSAAVDEALAELGKAPAGHAKHLLFVGSGIDPTFQARRAGVAAFVADNSQRPGHNLEECEQHVMQHWTATFDVTPLMAMAGGEVELVVVSKGEETEHVTVTFPARPTAQPSQAPSPPPTATAATSHRRWWLSGLGALVLVVLIVVVRRRARA